MSTAELDDFDEELEKLEGEIRKGIDGLKKVKEPERTNKVNYLNQRIQRMKTVQRSYKVELRDLDKTVAEPYQKKSKQYMDTINKLTQDLTWASESAALKETKGGPPVKKNEDLDTMTADEIVDKGAKTQEKSLDSLDSTLRIIEDTKGVGADTAAKLSGQTQQLQRIGEGLSEVDSYLKLASNQLRSYARRMATDKIILCFIVLIIGGILTIIIYSALHKNSNTNAGVLLGNGTFLTTG